MGGAQLEDHLVLGAEVDRLLVAAAAQVPDVQVVAVLVGEQQLGLDAALDHVRRAPLAGEQRVVADVPPDVVGQVLRAAVDLPAPARAEVVVVEQEHAARAVARRVAERARRRGRRGRSGRCAGGCSRCGGASSSGSIDLRQLGVARVVLDVDDVDAATSAGPGRCR